MPRATVSTEAQMFTLKSCPDGFVKLRRMSYGERLHRQDMAMAMSMESDARSKATELNIKQTQTAVAEFEYKTCIVDHNLEDNNDRKLDFSQPNDVHQLDGRIGEEIGDLIDKLHDWEADIPNSGQNSTGQSSGSVVVGEVLPATSPTTSG